jgi:Peptidase family C25/Interleukin-like EMT inducer/CARDB
VPSTLCTATVRLISNGSGSNKAGMGFNSTTVAGTDTMNFLNDSTVNFQRSYVSSKLKEGSNSITIKGYSTGAVVDQFLLDWADIDYYQYTNAVNDSILITIPDSVPTKFRIVKVGGLTTSNPIVYKITPSFSRIVNYSIAGTTTKTLYFADTVSGGDRYYVTSDANVRDPRFVEKKQFVNLRSSTHAADYIIISNKVLSSSTTAYESFIKSQYGVRTEVAYVDDIFDEFYYGYNHPEAIRDFLMRANTYWQAPAPSYLLLIGDANYDYKNVTTGISHIKPDLVPSYGDPVSDIWYVTWDSLMTGGVPQMYVGRIPAESDDDVEFYLQKHEQYLQKSYDDWNKTLIFFSGGDPGTAGQIQALYSENNSVDSTLGVPPPLGAITHHFYKTTNPTSDFGPYPPGEVQDAINTGAVAISYIGHSGTQTWDNGITSVSDLKNIYSNRFPMVTDFGCSTGKFAEPDIDCFGQLFLSEDRDGQAIAYLANTSLGYLSTALSFPTYFYRRILQDSITDIGQAHLLAKIQQLQGSYPGDASQVLDFCNLLFGDPILKLALPPKPNFVVDNSSLSILGPTPTDQEDSVAVQVVVKNLGLVPPAPAEVSISDRFNGETVFNTSFRIPTATFWDTTVIHVPIKNLIGQHTLTVIVDSANAIDEIYKTDNTASLSFAVYSTTVRSLDQSTYYNSEQDTITLLNPVYKIAGAPERMRLSLDTSDTFATAFEMTKNFDTVTTKIPLAALIAGRRYWWRAKIDEQSLQWSTPISFVDEKKGAQWFAESPDNQNSIVNSNTAYSSQQAGWQIVSSENTLKITSAGADDGSFASMLFNGNETLPSTFFWGIVTAVIDTATLQPTGFRYFTTSGGTTQEMTKNADSLTNYINGLANGTVLAVTICTDGAQAVLGYTPPSTVRNAIKQLGSLYIDSVTYRQSWCILGRKGAAVGSVPEAYSKLFAGPASVSISKTVPVDSGTVLFPAIGPSVAWDSLSFNSSVPAGSAIDIVPLGVRTSGGIDTLAPITITNNRGALSSISALNYPQVKLLVKLFANGNKQTPVISDIAVYYTKPSELALNYQVVGTYAASRVAGTDSVSISANPSDTVVQGKYLGLRWRVYNTGSATAKDVQVKTTVVWSNNMREELGTITVDSISAGSYKEIQLPYNSSAGSGGRFLQITVDPNDSIKEQFKDNNIFSYPFTVSPDTTVPPLPNLAINPSGIIVPSSVPDDLDSVAVKIIIQNTGSVRYDSVDVLVQQVYQSAIIKTWNLRSPIPILSDTLTVYPSIKNMPGEHEITVDIDPQSLIIESSKDDNSASKSFFVATTDFAALQPTFYNISYVPTMILLNPSAEVWDGVKKILLEIDTLNSFATAKSFTSTMGQFSTLFDISSLPKLTRYWWRAKVDNSTEDWTVGTFYQGDTTASEIGQADSTAWSGDMFVHTAFVNNAGVEVQNSPTHFRIVSAGYADGNFGDIEINGTGIIPANTDTCHYLVELDTNFTVIAKRRFDLFSDPSQSDSLAAFVNAVPARYYVVAVIIGEGATNLNAAAQNAYKSLGSKFINQIGWRDSWAIIGKKGALIGSVPEAYQATTTGKAVLDTTFYQKEFSGSVITSEFGPVASWKKFIVQSTVPAGASLSSAITGISRSGSIDTVASLTNGSSVALQNVSAAQYPFGKIVFSLQVNTAGASPELRQWALAAQPPTELATSPSSITVQNTTLNEGDVDNLAMKIYNVSGVDADSVTAEILTDDSGFPRKLAQVVFPVIHPQDSVTVQTQYDSRGKHGNHSFFFTIDPDSTLAEVNRFDNSFTVPYTVIADTVRPTVDVTFDGIHVFDGEYISSTPTIVFQLRDNNPAPLMASDTSSFSIWLNGNKVSFAPPEQIQFNPVQAQVIWKPRLPEGQNSFEYFVQDISGNSSDTAWIELNVTSTFALLNVFNIPDPFSHGTDFTFTLTGASIPDEMKIRIYTVAGRAIQEIEVPPGDLHIGFNKIFWDGRDRDGDDIANGVYFYRIVTNGNGKEATTTGKMVKMR